MAARRALFAALLAVFGAAACSDDPATPLTPDAASLAGVSDPDVPPRSAERPGTMIELSDEALWALVEDSDHRVAVGLKRPGANRGVYQGRVLVTRSEWTQARNAVLDHPGVELVLADDILPLVEVRVESLRALERLRRLPMVDYVEPVMAEQEMQQFAGVGGCGWGSTWSGDRQYTSTGDVYSERWKAMRIPDAWSLSTGAGVTVGVTDTGISTGQRQFFEHFTAGASGGRWIKYLNVSSMGTPWDECGHGTRMAGVAVGPHDGRTAGGVAYRANLVSVRQANGVAAVSSSDAKYSVRIAVQNGSKVVVMAWESLNWWWQVSDEIRYWHYNRPVLFLGAAGTSGCWDGIPDDNVVFPADMSEVVAVTGVGYPGGGIPCGIHHGPEVELTAYLNVPTTGRYTGDLVEIGGSSNATAVMGGIAALTWSRSPALTRDQLRQRLRQAGSYYPDRHSREGYGLVNALEAVRGH